MSFPEHCFNKGEFSIQSYHPDNCEEGGIHHDQYLNSGFNKTIKRVAIKKHIKTEATSEFAVACNCHPQQD